MSPFCLDEQLLWHLQLLNSLGSCFAEESTNWASKVRRSRPSLCLTYETSCRLKCCSLRRLACVFTGLFDPF